MNTQTFLPATTFLGAMLFSLLFSTPQPIYAQSNTPSPVIIVGKTIEQPPDSGQFCVSLSYGAIDVDTFTRDSLGWEWHASDGVAALKAGTVLIRSVAVFSSQHPRGLLPQSSYCQNQPRYYFTMNSTKIAGYNPGKGARDDRGTCWNQPAPCNVPVDRVTDTGG